jgi:hypothetical protein
LQLRPAWLRLALQSLVDAIGALGEYLLAFALLGGIEHWSAWLDQLTLLEKL